MVNAESSSDSGTANSQQGSPELNKWTLMIYHSGDPDLGEEFIWAMKEMARIGVSEGVQVVAFMDSVAPHPYHFLISSDTSAELAKTKTGTMSEAASQNNEDTTDVDDFSLFDPARGVVINPKPSGAAERNDTSAFDIAENRESYKGQVNAASATMLRDFIADSISKHPAEHYMLILSGHGDGIIGETLLLDKGSSRFLSVPRLTWALRDSIKIAINSALGSPGRIDILGFDACCMMTAEVCHLLRNRVDYVVSSQGFETLRGWPYHRILEYLNTHPQATPEEVAKTTVSRCIHYYSDYTRVGLSVDLAACRLDDEWEGIVEAMKALTHKLSVAVEAEANIDEAIGSEARTKSNSLRVTDALITAHWYAQSYAIEHYVDLEDFCSLLIEIAPQFETECTEIIHHIHGIVVKECYAGAGFQRSHGISLYFPWVATQHELERYSSYHKDSETIAKTPFNEATGWGDFLELLICKTHREPRRDKCSGDELISVPPSGFFDHVGEIETGVRTGVIPNIRSGTITNIKGNMILSKVKNPALSSFEDKCE